MWGTRYISSRMPCWRPPITMIRVKTLADWIPTFPRFSHGFANGFLSGPRGPIHQVLMNNSIECRKCLITFNSENCLDSGRFIPIFDITLHTLFLKPRKFNFLLILD